MEKEHYKEENIILRSRRLCGGLKDFKLIKRIGKGAFGEVILARKIKTNELVALKKISKSNQDKKQVLNFSKKYTSILYIIFLICFLDYTCENRARCIS